MLGHSTAAFDAWKWAIVEKDDKADKQNPFSVYLQGPTSHLWSLFNNSLAIHLLILSNYN